ncbi:MAG: hypothetical protein EOS38_25615 [Mesorhizobium sp.]|nr:MAG: hypothetical protein EOS39_29710 [Mesorhizobium sp.]RWD83352.1 MAG: hypothetical protein EOS38_25615 [Mesorhizobium sp.]
MRYPASEKLELVGQSHLPARCTLEKLGIPCATFHRWEDRGGETAATDRLKPLRERGSARRSATGGFC